MRANFIHIEAALRQVLNRPIPGDLAEFGVWRATTFMPMAELARINGRVIHAVDSFVGLPKATARDAGRYPEGTYNVGGSADFRELIKPYRATVVVHEGFVPAVLAQMADVQFAFVHLDLDQYGPTLDALRFIWPRMSPAGMLLCHDWFAERDTLAAGAIADWMAETGTTPVIETESQHAWFVK